MAVEVVPRRPSDMRRSVASGPTTTLTAVYHHGPSMMASSAGRDGGFNEHDLIYVTKSPDYCRRDRSSGSLGTIGRTCNASTTAHGGGCSSLCCGRGYVTSLREHVERCNCKYIWCCTVNSKKKNQRIFFRNLLFTYLLFRSNVRRVAVELKCTPAISSSRLGGFIVPPFIFIL